MNGGKTMNIFYTSITGDSAGRASLFFRNEKTAQAKADEQNALSEELKLNAHYEVVATTTKEMNIDPKEIRLSELKMRGVQ